jgi:NAD(P)-dependent dehydrogenase (short-subunit alcohol dehydrogenase family)
MGRGLSGRAALVTGARRGIGAAIAQRLAAAGASVVMAARTLDEDGLEAIVERIRQAGGRAQAIAFDLADAEARADAVARAAEAFGPVDILVNNAATNNYAPPSAMDLAFRREMFQVNVHAPVDLIQQALSHMREQSWGRIVNITSVSRTQPSIPYPGAEAAINGVALYGASKFALERFSIGLAAELHGTGVTVNSLYPTSVCVTGANSEVAMTALRAHPQLAEGAEMMAEAAILLAEGPLTGVNLPSRDILMLFQSPLHALDGVTVIGDAGTIPDLSKEA